MDPFVPELCLLLDFQESLEKLFLKVVLNWYVAAMDDALHQVYYHTLKGLEVDVGDGFIREVFHIEHSLHNRIINSSIHTKVNQRLRLHNPSLLRRYLDSIFLCFVIDQLALCRTHFLFFVAFSLAGRADLMGLLAEVDLLLESDVERHLV